MPSCIGRMLKASLQHLDSWGGQARGSGLQGLGFGALDTRPISPSKRLQFPPRGAVPIRTTSSLQPQMRPFMVALVTLTLGHGTPDGPRTHAPAFTSAVLLGRSAYLQGPYLKLPVTIVQKLYLLHIHNLVVQKPLLVCIIVW